MLWPSVCGLSPSPESRMAISTAFTTERSHTCTESMDGPPTETVASWLSGWLLP